MADVEQGSDAILDGSLTTEQIVDFDLFHEVFFALIRLDHPFIDLWLSMGARSSEPGAANPGAGNLVPNFCRLLARQRGYSEWSLTSYGVLRQLALGWKHVLKTNFADLKRRPGAVVTDGVPPGRDMWRRTISSRMRNCAPVEWASGANAASRGEIAWRFRMPGYPMVLISTSVLQEGEDLHTFCRHVTHFGISGSPIGIEQKNGRVDRVGSLSQRRLAASVTEPTLGTALDLAANGIVVRFPHVTESPEWLQIREMSFRLNEYQRSPHRLSETAPRSDPSMQDALFNEDVIPAQIAEKLESPFEPVIPEDDARL